MFGSELMRNMAKKLSGKTKVTHFSSRNGQRPKKGLLANIPGF
jgi:hypothetical protein